MAKLPFLSEEHEIEIAQVISTTFGDDSIVIRQLLRERAPNNWCTVALRAAASEPSAALQLSDGRCPACGCKPYFDKRSHTKHCPCCGRTFARDTGEQIEDQRWLQTAPGVFEDWSFDARVARGETRTLEDPAADDVVRDLRRGVDAARTVVPVPAPGDRDGGGDQVRAFRE